MAYNEGRACQAKQTTGMFVESVNRKEIHELNEWIRWLFSRGCKGAFSRRSIYHHLCWKDQPAPVILIRSEIFFVVTYKVKASEFLEGLICINKCH